MVYVDDMYKTVTGNFKNMKMSHMIADTDKELREMADKIGVLQKWHQGDHFDISLSKRILAVQYGAIEVTMKQLCCMKSRQRRTGQLGNPSDAVEWYINLISKAPPNS